MQGFFTTLAALGYSGLSRILTGKQVLNKRFKSSYEVCCNLTVSKSIQWILWFNVHYAAAASTATAERFSHREIFNINTLSGKLHMLASPNLKDIFIGW